jgi:small subunit ribosomal protein S14
MSFENAIKQIRNKPEKLARFMKFNAPKKRKYGKTTHKCRNCGKKAGVIRSYGLQYCRQCFREEAKKLGFNKYT